ncbi:MAG TPA: hypothetical protein VFV52_16085 [Bacilli bacterium]|nr:hypothetical protein [Bacilli bacterium]
MRGKGRYSLVTVVVALLVVGLLVQTYRMNQEEERKENMQHHAQYLLLYTIDLTLKDIEDYQKTPNAFTLGSLYAHVRNLGNTAANLKRVAGEPSRFGHQDANFLDPSTLIYNYANGHGEADTFSGWLNQLHLTLQAYKERSPYQPDAGEKLTDFALTWENLSAVTKDYK